MMAVLNIACPGAAGVEFNGCTAKVIALIILMVFLVQGSSFLKFAKKL